MDLNAEAARVHKANEKWWVDLQTRERITRNKGEMLMLMVSELSEALEGDRKGLMDDKIPSRKMEEVEMADFIIRLLDYAGGWGHELYDMPLTGAIKENKGENLLWITHHTTRVMFAEHSESSDVGEFLSVLVSAVQRYCEHFGLDLWGAYEDKMAYNAVRPDHKLSARMAEGGKKY